MLKSQVTPTAEGLVTALNQIANFDGYYISYCSSGIQFDTTAIVLGQMERFYILDGDHSNELEALSREGGVQACIKYFYDHIEQASRYSEHLLTDDAMALALKKVLKH
jgi:hypothetical protein